MQPPTPDHVPYALHDRKKVVELNTSKCVTRVHVVYPSLVSAGVPAFATLSPKSSKKGWGLIRPDIRSPRGAKRSEPKGLEVSS